jgi:Acetyltransferase (GNAT) domain
MRNWVELFDGKSTCEYGVFHTPEWMEFVLSVSNHCRDESLVFTVDGRIVAFMPLVAKRVNLTREYWSHLHDEYGGLICVDHCDESIVRQIERHLFQTFAPLRITADPLLPRYFGEFNCPWKRATTYTHVLSLPSSYDEWFTACLRANCRNMIRKAIKCGVKVTTSKTETDLVGYYQLYLTSAERWGTKKQRLLPLDYFRSLVQLSHVRLYLALHEDKPMGGVIALHCPKYSFYYRAAMDKSFAKFNPMYLLMDRLIADSISEQKQFVNMGSSNGIREVEVFKENFGARPHYYDVLYTDTWLRRGRSAFNYYVVNGPARIKKIQKRLFSREVSQ